MACFYVPQLIKKVGKLDGNNYLAKKYINSGVRVLQISMLAIQPLSNFENVVTNSFAQRFHLTKCILSYLTHLVHTKTM